MSRRRSKGLLAPDRQVPAAIGLTVVFVAMLGWRYQQHRAQAVKAGPAPAAAVAAPFESHLAELVSTIKLDAPTTATARRVSLAIDPFAGPVRAVKQAATSGGLAIPQVPDEMEMGPEGLALRANFPQVEAMAKPEPSPAPLPDWKAIAAGLSLDGVCESDRQSMAIVNGQNLLAGQHVGDLQVTRIGTMGIELRDPLGTTYTLLMKGPQF